MRIKTIRAHHYLSLRAKVIEVPASARAIFITGPNGAGKTALLEGIRAVLDGTLPRGLGYKKDLPQLITDGEKDGLISVTVNKDGRDTELKLSLKSGAGTDAPLEKLAVSPQEFMALDANKRRRALFDLYNIPMSKGAIVEQLVKDGHSTTRVEAVTTALGAGFEAAAKRAKELVSEARGGWQATTGENYGSNKAEVWVAPTQTFDNPGDPEELTAQLDRKRASARELVHTRNALRAAEDQHQQADASRALADGLGHAEALLASHDEKIAAARAKVSELRAAASSAGGWTAPCPCCGTMLRSEKAGQLVEHDPTAPSGPRASAAAEAAECDVRALTDERVRLQRDVDTCRAAKMSLERLPERPTPEALAAAEEAVRSVTEEGELLVREVEKARAAADAVMLAETATRKAAGFHADVKGYTELAAAIEAMPARFLSEALDGLNGVLAKVSASFTKPVTMGEDMELRYGTVPYRTLSESQRWRCELALGLAIAAQGSGIVLMDRFDMVQPSDRGAILQMLGAQEFAQVFIGATLKGEPTFPEGSGLYVEWLGY
ncbi:MAG TPA: ATP-binding protein [Solirubrobacterales bacterium]